MKKQKVEKMRVGVLPAELDGNGEKRVVRDLKNGEEIVYYEDPQRDLLIREVLPRDLRDIWKLKTKNSQGYLIINKKTKEMCVVPEEFSEDIILETIKNARKRDTLRLQLLVFKMSTATIMAATDICWDDADGECANMQFLFERSISPKSKEIIKKEIADFLKEYKLSEKAYEFISINGLKGEYAVKKIS